MATIAAVGVSPYPWAEVKKVVSWAAAVAIDEMLSSSQPSEAEARAAADSKQQLLHALARTTLMPFTGQRLCEILLEPRRYYSSAAKLAYALEKLLRVSAVNADLSPDEFAAHLEALARDSLPAKKPAMMAIDVDLRPPPALMMGEGNWGVQQQQPPPPQQQQSQQQQQQQQDNKMDISD